jgi:hypothetical protein
MAVCTCHQAWGPPRPMASTYWPLSLMASMHRPPSWDVLAIEQGDLLAGWPVRTGHQVGHQGVQTKKIQLDNVHCWTY